MKYVAWGVVFKVAHKGTSKTYSNKPQSKAKAKAQMRAMYANTKREAGGRLV